MGNLIQASVPAGNATQEGYACGPNMGTIQWAVNHNAWWVFWFELDSGGTGTSSHLKMFAKYSSDLATWSTPTTANYQAAGTRVSYNQWCVTYQNLGAGYDVIFITRQDNFNSNGGPWYDRFTLGSSDWTRTNGDTYLTALDNNNGWMDAVTFDSSGYPVVCAPGNVSISPNQDSGSAWTAGWGTAKSLSTAACGMLFPMTSRALLSIGVNVNSVSGNYQYSYYSGSTFSSAANIFTTNWNTSAYIATAAACAVGYGNVHAVNCDVTHSYTWNHRIFNGSSWSNGGTIPSLTPYLYSQNNAGVPMALVTDGTNLYLFTVAATTYDIKYVKYDGGAGTWGSWTLVDSGDSTHIRINMTGCQQGNGNYPAVTYLQQNGSNWDLRATGFSTVPVVTPHTDFEIGALVESPLSSASMLDSDPWSLLETYPGLLSSSIMSSDFGGLVEDAETELFFFVSELGGVVEGTGLSVDLSDEDVWLGVSEFGAYETIDYFFDSDLGFGVDEVSFISFSFVDADMGYGLEEFGDLAASLLLTELGRLVEPEPFTPTNYIVVTDMGSGLEWASARSVILFVYNVYANTGIGDPINYASPVFTTGLLTWTTVLSTQGVWKFAVRCQDTTTSLEEKNIEQLVVAINQSWVDVSTIPAAPTALKSINFAGAVVKIAWSYVSPPGSTVKPVGFHVYTSTTGIGGLTLAGTVPYGGDSQNYSLTLGLTGGTTYTVVVRSYTATFEEANTNSIIVVPDSTPPNPPASLSIVATSDKG